MHNAARPTRPEIDAFFAQLKTDRANLLCFDCRASGPTWASVSLGLYLCLDCSGRHRSLGVHISFVRSLNLDSWNWDQLRLMKAGGNTTASDFLCRDRFFSADELDITRKYSSPIVSVWREHLKALAENDKKLCPDSMLMTSVVGTGAPFAASGSTAAMPHLSMATGATATAAVSSILERDDFFVASPQRSGTNTPAEDMFESAISPVAKASSLGTGLISSSRTRIGTVQTNSSRQRPARGLGAAVKKVSNVNFDEAVARAKKAEEDRATIDLQTELSRQRELVAASSQLPPTGFPDTSLSAKNSGSSAGSGVSADNSNYSGADASRQQNSSSASSGSSTSNPSGSNAPPKTGPGMERLGMGRVKWQTSAPGQPSVTGMSNWTSSSSGSSDQNSSGSQHKKYGSGISSETYFAKGEPSSSGVGPDGRSLGENDQEKNMRNQRVAGREGISSADYFGSASSGTGDGQDKKRSGESGAAMSNLSNLEDGAKDIARKVVTQAVADFNTIKNLAAVTAARIQNSISEMQRNGTSGNFNDNYGGSGGNRYSGF